MTGHQQVLVCGIVTGQVDLSMSTWMSKNMAEPFDVTQLQCSLPGCMDDMLQGCSGRWV